MFSRALLGIGYAILVLFSPWWLYFILGFIILVFYENFWEFPALAIIADLLYGVPISLFYGFTFVGGAGALILFFTRRVIARRLFIRPANN